MCHGSSIFVTCCRAPLVNMVLVKRRNRFPVWQSGELCLELWCADPVLFGVEQVWVPSRRYRPAKWSHPAQLALNQNQ